MIRRRPTRSPRRPSAQPDGQAPVVLAKLLDGTEPQAPQLPPQTAAATVAPAHSTDGSFTTPSLFTDPDSTPGFTSGTTTRAVPVRHGGRTYRVRTDDTLPLVAAKHGVSAPALIELNNLRGHTQLRPGQILSLPEKNDKPAPGGYRVRPGDTLDVIAAQHSTTPQRLRRANSMGDSSLLVEGEVLTLTGTGASSGRARPAIGAELPRLPVDYRGRAYPPEVVAAARTNKHILGLHPAPSRAWVEHTLRVVAGQFGVAADLAIAVAVQESGLHHHTVSPVNAVGIMQLTPRAGAWAATLAGRTLNITDPADNIVAGIAIIARLLRTQPDEASALAAYYQGAASVAEHGRAPDTRAFVRTVQVTRARYGVETT